jgi:NADPH-dependent glutamate synthase beta subunit-like oxidoreductase/NAD(P)H-flavin reductase
MTEPLADNKNGEPLALGIEGFSYRDLFQPERLRLLQERFSDDLAERDPEAGRRYRKLLEQANPTRQDESWVTEAVGPHLSRFLSTMFGLDQACREVEAKTRELDTMLAVRRDFVRKRVVKGLKPADREGADITALDRKVTELTRTLGEPQKEGSEEQAFARMVTALISLENAIDSAKADGGGFPEEAGTAVDRLQSMDSTFPTSADLEALATAVGDLIRKVQIWSAYHVDSKPRPAATRHWEIFRLQQKVDFRNLVEREYPHPDKPHFFQGSEATYRHRVGFELTDHRYEHTEMIGELDLCIFCHNQERDSCYKGVKDKKGNTKTNPVGIVLDGCPLDEHISEAQLLRQQGDALAGLATVMINNPMCPGTGHRICNDCMKACIFQKQDPVNIPQIETGILTDVLDMPWGMEVYGLLTRWNPLNIRRPYQLPLNGKRVLVVGLGPAGYTLAHFLTSEGFAVVAVDGLKLEPLPGEQVGEGFAPLPSWQDFIQPLDQRILDGFGGVSEYGITVRWDKNFLRLLYLTLLRKPGFTAYGGVRFGGTLTLEDAAELGFDHVAIATGAGKPTIVPMKNNLLRGVRMASDFLMALQLTGASKDDSLANLQVRMPAVVLGGGLTAIDTATELMAYYPAMVERVLKRSAILKAEGRLDAFLEKLVGEEKTIYEEFIAHGKAVVAEKERAATEGREPDIIKLVRGWGGVTLAYRRTVQESPAYRLNHEEVIKALEEGIYFDETISPTEAVADEHGSIKTLRARYKGSDDEVELPCRSLMVAAGTSPNIVYELEHPDTFDIDGKFFKPFNAAESNGEIKLEDDKDPATSFFTSYNNGGLTVSYYGDNHPAYAGNVVKAMASARNGYPKVVDIFRSEISGLDPAGQRQRDRAHTEFVARLDDVLKARVVRVERLTSTITEVVLRAPYQARKFHPGQFYRLQNFDANAPKIKGFRMAMEGVALTGAWVDKEQGLLSLIILEMGGSSDLCAYLQPGEEVVCMGPTGAPTEIPSNANVVLLGGGLGNAVLFSIAKACKEAGSKVLYFAGYKNGADLFKRDEVEEATDQVIFSTDMGDQIEPRRPRDAHFRGNIVQAMIAYSNGEFGAQLFPLDEAEHLVAIGSDRMMAAVKAARHDPSLLQPHLKEHTAVASINSPMQCMMKKVCAQCLQRHVDPETGEETFVFSCFNQDQGMDEVDFSFLNSRLRQNNVLEKQSVGILGMMTDAADLPHV